MRFKHQIKLIPLKTYRLVIKSLRKTNIEKLSVAKKIHDFIIPKLVPKYVEIDGHKIFLDSKDFLYISTGQYEPFEQKIIEEIVKKGDVVVDVGANLGYFTLILARKVGPLGKVFAFEPDPDAFALLKKNIKVNGYRNVILENKAVFNREGKINLQIYADKSNSPKTRDSTKTNESLISVDVVSLDSYFKDYHKEIDFIKMDIEGAEGMAFKGFTQLINKNKDMIIISEFFPMLLKEHDMNAKKYAELLFAMGFSLYKINEKKKRLELVKRKNELININEGNFTNLLCLKNSSVSKIKELKCFFKVNSK